MSLIRVALCQVNPTVGDIDGNLKRMLKFYGKAREYQCDIVAFPELSLCGYPPEDLLFRQDFIDAIHISMKTLARAIDYPTAIVGFAHLKEKKLYNSAGIIGSRKILGIYHKIKLPNYGVFDEKRYFSEGEAPLLLFVNGVKIGVEICEDLWDPSGPSLLESRMGAEAIITINASPYSMGKPLQREMLIRKTAKECRCHLFYMNLVGGQDELIFDGQSMIADPSGKIQLRGKAFEEDILICDINLKGKIGGKGKNTAQIVNIPKPEFMERLPLKKEIIKPLPLEEEIYKALLLGTRDYIQKNGFKSVVIGISGGIDSALVAKVACDAIGRENVTGIFMPSKYTSIESRRCVYDLKKSLKIKLLEIPIDPIFRINLEALKEIFGNMPGDETEENIQARIRGILLMALSNKFGHLVLTTGNKSEMSVGYTTLYGDMAGGFAVIKDIPKTLVYKIAGFCNRNGTIIPEEIIERAPTAELRKTQKDQDSLPPYAILDKILKSYVEEDLPIKNIKRLFNSSVVEKVIRLVDKSEYKRRQSPPGIKITPRSLGKDRRMPITQRYRSK